MLKVAFNNKRGFTLIELMVTTLIFVAILGILYGLQFAVNDLFFASEEKVDLMADGRIALEYMRRELKNATRVSTQNPAPNLVIPSTPNNKSVQFYLPKDKDGNGLITDSNGEIEWATNEMVQYQYVPGQKMLKRIAPAGDQKILAKEVTDVQFIDAGIDSTLDIHEVKIILTLTKTTSRGREVTHTLTTFVRLRN